jgi:hypothetical protein
LTDYEPGRAAWSATLIALGASVEEARRTADESAAALAAEERLVLRPEDES